VRLDRWKPQVVVEEMIPSFGRKGKRPAKRRRGREETEDRHEEQTDRKRSL
jgi:hypothetical protein